MLRLKLLGGLSVERDSARVDVRERKALTLLAVVALAPDGIARAKLLALFWPESDEDRAANALRQRLFGLRRDIAEPALLTGTTELRLNPEVITTDLADFEKAVAAGDVATADSLYGTLLDGVFVKDAPDLERWIDDRRDSLARVARKFFSDAARKAEQEGDFRAAAQRWRRTCAFDPTDADSACGLIRALDRAGDPAGALQHYRIYETLMRVEYHLEPDARVTAAAERVRAPRRSPPLTAAPPVVEPAATGYTPLPEAAPPRGRTHRRTFAFVAASLVVLASVVTTQLLARSSESAAVAVIPFENATGDTAFESLGAIAADQITQGLVLAAVPRVVDSRLTVARSARGSAASAPVDFARALGAGTVVAGTYFIRGDSIVLQSRIVDVPSSRVIQALDPISALKGEPMLALERLRQKVIGAVATLSDSTLATTVGVSEAPSWDAYREYLAGVQWAGIDWSKATPHLMEAVRRDPRFVHASLLAAEGSSRPVRDSLIATVMVRRDSLAPFDRARLDYLVAFDSGDNEAALVAARRMTQLAPASADGQYSRGYLALATNRLGEAIHAFEQIDLDRSWMADWWLFSRWPGRAYHLAGRYDHELALARDAHRRFPREFEICQSPIIALAAMRRITEIEQRVADCRSAAEGDTSRRSALMRHTAAMELRAHGHHADANRFFDQVIREAEDARAAGRIDDVALGGTYYDAGRWQDALRLLRPRLDTIKPNRPRVPGMVAVAAARVGDSSTATALRQWLERMDRTGRFPAATMWLARVAASEGRADAAIALLRAHRVSALVLHGDHAFDQLSGNPELDALLRSR